MKLNPSAVIIRNGNDKHTTNNPKSVFFKDISLNLGEFNPDDIKYDALNDQTDPISSKNIVNSVCMISENVNDEITSGCIMMEIQRLLVRSIRVDNKIDCTNLNSILFGTAMQSVKTCIESIVSDKADPANYYRSIILYSIASLMDIHNISTESKEAAKLPAFINYFVDAFTKTSK